MMIKLYITSYIGLILLSSCTALKKVTARDNSNSAPAPAQNNNQGVAFLDNISITPGGPPAKGDFYTPATRSGTTQTKPAKNVTGGGGGSSNAAVLQAKYSVILNVNPDKLTNIALLQVIDHWWGTKYCMGGSTEDCIDCSGFVQTILRDVYGISIPRVAQEQYDNSLHIDNGKLSEGDLVFFHTTGRGRSVTHVGVYVANNKFAHAATVEGVTISDLSDPYWQPKFIGAGRMSKSVGILQVNLTQQKVVGQ